MLSPAHTRNVSLKWEDQLISRHGNETAMKSSRRRDCALQGANVSVIKNVSKQQMKANYVCFPGLCLYRGLSLASAVGDWQLALLCHCKPLQSTALASIRGLLCGSGRIAGERKISLNQHRYRRADEILGVQGYLGVSASCRLKKKSIFLYSLSPRAM